MGATTEEAGGGRPALLDGDMCGREARRALYTAMQRARNSGCDPHIVYLLIVYTRVQAPLLK